MKMEKLCCEYDEVLFAQVYFWICRSLTKIFQTPDSARAPEQPRDEAEVNLLRKIPKMKNQAGYRLKEDFEAFEPPSTYYIQSENVL